MISSVSESSPSRISSARSVRPFLRQCCDASPHLRPRRPRRQARRCPRQSTLDLRAPPDLPASRSWAHEAFRPTLCYPLGPDCFRHRDAGRGCRRQVRCGRLATDCLLQEVQALWGWWPWGFACLLVCLRVARLGFDVGCKSSGEVGKRQVVKSWLGRVLVVGSSSKERGKDKFRWQALFWWLVRFTADALSVRVGFWGDPTELSSLKEGHFPPYRVTPTIVASSSAQCPGSEPLFAPEPHCSSTYKRLWASGILCELLRSEKRMQLKLKAVYSESTIWIGR